MKKRILAMTLALMMFMGMLPMNIFADSKPLEAAGATGNLVVEFDSNELGPNDTSTSLVLRYDGADAKFTNVDFAFDWTELGENVSSLEISSRWKNSLVAADTDGIEGDIEPGTNLSNFRTVVQIAATKESNADMAVADFTFNGGLEPGIYKVPVAITLLANMTDDGLITYHDDKERPITMTAVLKVKDAEGNVPSRPVEYAIGTIVLPDANKGTIEVDATAPAGKAVTATITPATGYQFKTVSVKQGTETVGTVFDMPVNGEPVDVTFTMPEGDVVITAEFEGYEAPVQKYDLAIGSFAHGTVHLNGVAKAAEGDPVTIFARPDAGYRIDSVRVNGEDGKAVSVEQLADKGANGETRYAFTMPACKAAVSVDFRVAEGDVPTEGNVTAGNIHIKGRVMTSENNYLSGARVVLRAENNQTIADVTKETDGDGLFDFGEVDGHYNYTVKAFYDTGIKEGHVVADGIGQVVCESDPVTGITGSGEWKTPVLTVTLKYDWDFDRKGLKTIYAGPDDKFLTTDDYYEVTVGTTEVRVMPSVSGDGNIAMANCYYKWDVDGDDEQEQVFVGESLEVPSADNHYLVDADPGNLNSQIPAEMNVKVGPDGIPCTADDFFEHDINRDGVSERVEAGVDGRIPSGSNFYVVNYGTSRNYVVHVGEDETAATPDDWYEITIDGETKKAFVAKDLVVAGNGMVTSNDDYYLDDIDGREDVPVYCGEDGEFGTAKDFYKGNVPFGTGSEVTVFGTAGEDGRYRFGHDTDHYAWTVGDKSVDVRIGGDLKCGTGDDEYGWTVSVYAIENDTKVLKDVAVTVVAGSGVPGSTGKELDGDWYMLDADHDGTDEKVFVGLDGIAGTADDLYVKDVNGDGNDEKVYAGEGGHFGDAKDYYNDHVVNAYGEKDVQVFAGEDGDIGTSDDCYFMNADHDEDEEYIFVGADRTPGTEDDYYRKDVNGDGTKEQVYAGIDKTFPTVEDYYEKDVDGDGAVDKVFAGIDATIGTEDDYYLKDPDGDGEPDRVYVGVDKIAGTSDDWYYHDVDGKEPLEKVYAGPDGIIGTEDDIYPFDVDHNPETPDVDVHVGPDGKPGTEDDWYDADVNGDGNDEHVFVGPDGKPGTDDDFYWMHKEDCGCIKDTDGDGVADTTCPCTPEDDNCGCWTKVTAGDTDHGGDNTPGTKDDWYMKDVDGDGEDEKVYIGDDRKPGTADDWYYADIRWDANGGTTEAVKILTVDLQAVPTATRSGYNFNGWTLEKDKGTILKLEDLKALKVDTTVYASWTRRYSGGGGGGGGSSSGNRQPVAITDPKTPLAESPVLDAVKKIFNLDHITYILGYSDGGVHADENMTRAQAAVVFYRLLNDTTRKAYKTDRHDFSDITKGSWYETAVATLARMGIMTGYGNGKFGPDDHMTRAEFAAICARIGGFTEKVNYTFVDVPEDFWAHDAIAAVAKAGWMAGYGDSTFGPRDFVTRASVVTMMNRILARDKVDKDSFATLKTDKAFRTWNDIDDKHWAYYDLVEAGNGHDYKKEDDGMELWTGLKKD